MLRSNLAGMLIALVIGAAFLVPACAQAPYPSRPIRIVVPFFTHRQLIATLDANGVDRAVIAAASPWGDYNDYILAALRAYPARLRGTAIFNGPVDRFALEAMGREGFVGMRLPFIGLPKLPDISSFHYRALFRRLAAHEGQFPYQATIDWLVEAIPDATARGKIFGATARELYFNGH